MSLITARRCCSWLLAPAVLCALLAPGCEDDPGSGGVTPAPVSPNVDGGQTPGNDAGETPTAKPNPLDALNPVDNARMGARYLRHLLGKTDNNLRQALIAYNQGLTSLRTRGSFGDAERYADRVLALRPQFRTA